MKTAREYLVLYEQGIYTAAEMAGMFIVWASERHPETFLTELPQEIVELIVAEVARPPNSIDGVVTVKNSSPSQNLAWFNGAWVMHQYLSTSK